MARELGGKRPAQIVVAFGGVTVAAVVLPIAPVNSPWWNAIAYKGNADWPEEIGWPELVETVAKIRDSLPAEERVRAGILAGNPGEAGAINLYSPAYGLPKVISGANSYAWQRYLQAREAHQRSGPWRWVCQPAGNGWTAPIGSWAAHELKVRVAVIHIRQKRGIPIRVNETTRLPYDLRHRDRPVG